MRREANHTTRILLGIVDNKQAFISINLMHDIFFLYSKQGGITLRHAFSESIKGYGASQVIALLLELDDIGSFLLSHIKKWKCDFQYNGTINNYRLQMKPRICTLLAHDNLTTRIIPYALHLSLQNRQSDNFHLRPTTMLCFFMKQSEHPCFALRLRSSS